MSARGDEPVGLPRQRVGQAGHDQRVERGGRCANISHNHIVLHVRRSTSDEAMKQRLGLELEAAGAKGLRRSCALRDATVKPKDAPGGFPSAAAPVASLPSPGLFTSSAFA
eukprot:scaffold7679_cov403-Prasinococcus_capsulatus_cf.AAC.9